MAGKDWSGSFYSTEQPGRTGIKATITQSGNAVTITTSRAAGSSGHYFTGTIQTSGSIRLVDAADGETWTTHFGPANSTYVKLADFVRPPVAGESTGFFVIELSRRGGTRPANVRDTQPNSTPPSNPTAPSAPATPEPPPALPPPPPLPAPEPLPA